MVAAWFLYAMYGLIALACCMLECESDGMVFLKVTSILRQLWGWFSELHPDAAKVIADWGWVGLLAAAFGLEEGHEYAVAMVLLIASCASLGSLTLRWKGLPDNPTGKVLVRIFGYLLCIFVLLIGGIYIIGAKNNQPWSRLPDYAASFWPTPETIEVGCLGCLGCPSLPSNISLTKTPPWTLEELAREIATSSNPRKSPVQPPVVSIPPCIHGSPRVDSGPDGYKGVCDDDLGQWILDEAEKLTAMANDCETQISNSATTGQSVGGIRFFFDTNLKKCCTDDTKHLRAEAIRRLGPLAMNPEEQSQWENVFLDERFPASTSPPSFRNQEIGCLDVQEYVPYFRNFGFKLKQRVMPREPSAPVPFSESPAPSKGNVLGIDVTIQPNVPVNQGFIVVEFNGPLSEIDNYGQFHRAERIVDNKPLSEYLSGKMATSVSMEIGSLPLSKANPYRVRAYGAGAIHVAKVTWFDEEDADAALVSSLYSILQD